MEDGEGFDLRFDFDLVFKRWLFFWVLRAMSEACDGQCYVRMHTSNTLGSLTHVTTLPIYICTVTLIVRELYAWV